MSEDEAEADAVETSQDKVRYGVGEWFGRIVANATIAELNDLADKSTKPLKETKMPCPFRQKAEPGALCNKKGGVCTLRKYQEAKDGTVSAVEGFVTVCPNRFWHDNIIFHWIGTQVLGVANPIVVKEVDFLESVVINENADADEQADAVGRIDMVLVDPANQEKWCAVEVQAVYFSGRKMSEHLAQFEDVALEGLPFPNAVRRPDFRSSGPKRLMPQLQTKVPTLRRWGRKTAVIVDEPFAKSLGKFVEIPHISNCDILWVVVDYEEARGALKISRTILTTLESSVEALTAGTPRSRQEFENKIASVILSKNKAMMKKVIKLA